MIRDPQKVSADAVQVFPVANVIDWLRDEFHQRNLRNPKFSMRAFARLLGVAPGPLSEILANKRKITAQTAERLAKKLRCSGSELNRFLSLIRSDETTPRKSSPLKSQKLSADKFRLVSDWYHLAILSLFETSDFDGEESSIAARLGISASETRRALHGLKRLGFCRKLKSGWKSTGGNETNTAGTPSEAIRKFHGQNLARAQQILETAPFESRDFTSVTMAIDPTRLSVAKRRIQRFRRALAKYLEQGNRTEVYQFNLQLFPVNPRRRKK